MMKMRISVLYLLLAAAFATSAGAANWNDPQGGLVELPAIESAAEAAPKQPTSHDESEELIRKAKSAVREAAAARRAEQDAIQYRRVVEQAAIERSEAAQEKLQQLADQREQDNKVRSMARQERHEAQFAGMSPQDRRIYELALQERQLEQDRLIREQALKELKEARQAEQDRRIRQLALQEQQDHRIYQLAMQERAEALQAEQDRRIRQLALQEQQAEQDQRIQMLALAERQAAAAEGKGEDIPPIRQVALQQQQITRKQSRDQRILELAAQIQQDRRIRELAMQEQQEAEQSAQDGRIRQLAMLEQREAQLQELQPVGRPAEVMAVAETTKELPVVQSVPAMPAMTETASSQRYRIGAGDQLYISVWKDEALTRNLVVSPDGSFSFPLIGTVQAAGKSLLQLQQELEQRLATYVPDPVLSLELIQVNSMHIFVLGRVNHPGRFALNSSVNVLQALAMAGGLTPYADEEEIKVIREQPDVTKTFLFNYQDVTRGRDLEANIRLQRGDVILVP